MVSVPTFNPNRFDVPQAPMVRGRDGKMRAGVIQCDQLSLCNRVVQARYELGSVFKPLSIGAAMDAGVVTDMSKSRKLGFTEYQPTDESFFQLFERLRAERLIP